MGPFRFASTVVAGSGVPLLIGAAAVFLAIDEPLLSPRWIFSAVFVAAGFAGVLVSSPLWFYLTYEPWRRIEGSRGRGLTLVAIVLGVTLFALALCGFSAVGAQLLSR